MISDKLTRIDTEFSDIANAIRNNSPIENATQYKAIEMAQGIDTLANEIYQYIPNATSENRTLENALPIKANLFYEGNSTQETEPSPEYPSEIKNVFEISEVIQNNNLWNEEWEKGAIQASSGAKTIEANRIRNKNFISVKPNTTIYYEIDSKYSSLRIACYDKNKTYLGQNVGWLSPKNNNFTTPNNCYYINFVAVISSEIYDSGIILSYEQSTYTPHQETNITIPLQQPLRSVGETRDCFEKVEGKWYEVHKIGEVVIDGINLKLVKNDNGANSFLYFVDFNHNSKGGLCNYFEFVDAYPLARASGKFNLGKQSNVIYFNGYGIVSADNATLNDASEFNNWASSHNIKVIYPLAEPLYLECTKEQVEVLENIRLFDGTNYIIPLNEVEPKLKAKYYINYNDMVNESV